MMKTKIKRWQIAAWVIGSIILILSFFSFSAKAQTNTNQSISFGSALQDVIKSIGSEIPTNFVVAPYASYALNDHTNRWGGGIFGGWNINQNIGLGAAFDYNGNGFTMFSGQLTLRVPTRPLSFIGWTNLLVTPFVLGGIGTPISGGGHTAETVSSIAAAGADIDVLKFKSGWRLGVQGTFAQWSGSGTQDGKHIYGGLTLSKGF